MRDVREDKVEIQFQSRIGLWGGEKGARGGNPLIDAERYI
jgi:hypothetical protein